MKEDLVDKEEFIDVANAAGKAITLWIEPWCLEFTMQPDEVIIVQGTGPRRGRFLVAYLEDQITVWAWPGSTVKVYRNSQEEAIGDLPRVPPIPGWEDLFELDYFQRKHF